ncbi:MAG: SWIM zinc finger family protein [Propionicimonas sp.]|uniref:SWIM zinc finger family protein n=1 Tax=Propionicimonas sp. TaxID=1955623 RepID=UPI003D129C94
MVSEDSSESGGGPGYSPVMRTFAGASAVDGADLSFALAPALTPDGVTLAPSFFHGFATHPQVLARGLVTLADVTATRYFNYVPSSLRDPVLTAQGDRLRAECFSACNGVYARLDLLGGGFDGGEIAHGTTNVDLGLAMRQALSAMGHHELLHLDVGVDGLRASTPDATVTERPVEMPDRWVRALGNVAELHHGLPEAFRVAGPAAQSFIAGLPSATGKASSGWLALKGSGLRLVSRRVPDAIRLNGLNRLSALKRVLTHVTGLVVYSHGEGPVVVSVELPDARLSLGLTDEAWRGFSGEGALLSALGDSSAAEDANLVGVLLAFDPVIDVDRLARESALPAQRLRAALAVLASSGRVGWDTHDQAWFHRELPDDPERITRDNPRLVAATALVAAGAVHPDGSGGWMVHSSGEDHAVALGNDPADPTRGARCTCPWYLRHAGDRGPCKHVLAVRLTQRSHR